MFLNLIENALKYRKPDVAPVVRITSELDGGSGRCRVAVADNGVGFDQAHAESIFELFRRPVTFDEFEGSGIGLTTVKKLVDIHGGTITVSSEPGVGSTFVVELPTADEEAIRSQLSPLSTRSA